MTGQEYNHQVPQINKHNFTGKTAQFDNLACKYDSWFEQEEGKLIFSIELLALEKVINHLPKPWMEIGVGSGRFAQALKIETGIDPSSNLLKLADNRGINVVSGTGEQLPFRQASFGSVFLISTICFVDSPSRVLEEARRILIPEGNIVIGIIPKDSPWGKLYREKKKEGHSLYQYATFYKYQDMAASIEKADFSIAEVISTLFQKPVNVTHMESPQNGLHSGAGFMVIVAKKKDRT